MPPTPITELTLIVVAENDILRDEGEAMGRRLDEAGVEVTTVRFNGVVPAINKAIAKQKYGIKVNLDDIRAEWSDKEQKENL